MSSLQKFSRLPLSLNPNSKSYLRYQVRFSSPSNRFQPSIYLNRSCVRVAAETPRILNIDQFKTRKIHSGSAKSKIVNFLLPDIGEGINEVVIKEWHVSTGNVVKEFDPICDVESDKATATISSRYDGTIKSIHYEVGTMAKVGKPLVDIEITYLSDDLLPDKKVESKTKQIIHPEYQVETCRSSERSSSNVTALPSVRRLAVQMNVDINLVEPTGTKGQVLREDVLRYLKDKNKVEDEKEEIKTFKTKIDEVIPGDRTIVPLNTISKAMCKIMTEALKIPHFNYADEIDITNMIQANEKLKQMSDKKVSYFAHIIKMVSLALLDYPQLNASIDVVKEQLIQKNYHNIGVAIDTKAGLIVPNIKNVQNLSTAEIHSELLRLRELGYNNKLGPSDLTGATITLSNIGSIGGTFGVPVIVPPEIVIGAIGKARKLPRFNSSGQVEARHILQIVWSADHRVVDGATLGRFSNLLKLYLEEPHAAIFKLN